MTANSTPKVLRVGRSPVQIFTPHKYIRLQRYATFPAKSPADPPHWGTGDGESGKPTDEDGVKVLMLLTVILFIIISSSPPNSFIPWLKRSFSANPSHRSLTFLLQD